MHIVYTLQSINRNYIYVGMTSDLEKRIARHNKGYNKTTKACRSFILIYVGYFLAREEARGHENYYSEDTVFRERRTTWGFPPIAVSDDFIHPLYFTIHR